ncbi:hypothetical protein CLOHAE12215_01350 [Clostridium haemolyticum]|uniref:hypothetical protein n=1 Tax=Clostridium TaxID=1485 RepID=UPI001C3BCB0F|nr:MULTISPECIES: hypothetical protein [Clostridium]MCD3217333.1 hypothetical protein [Clostridium botulinum C]CAG7839934.1 hypothetical protein CLOHAE12215_01350 [Clostridium haemolyticum]
MHYQYDEETYAKLIYEKGFQTRFIRYELVVLVKYLKTLDYTKKDTERFIYDFCNKYIEGFNKVKYFKIIDGAIRDGRKKDNKLIVVKDVPIFVAEIEYIDSLELEDDYKKLLLAFLVNKKISLAIYKLSNPNANLSTYVGGSVKKFNKIFKTANITSKLKINEMINKLVQYGLVTSVIRGDIILTYMDNIPEDQEVFYKLSNNEFENVGYVFDYYKKNDKIKKCEKCKALVKTKSNKTKYCPKCAREINIKKTIENRKKRNCLK